MSDTARHVQRIPTHAGPPLARRHQSPATAAAGLDESVRVKTSKGGERTTSCYMGVPLIHEPVEGRQPVPYTNIAVRSTEDDTSGPLTVNCNRCQPRELSRDPPTLLPRLEVLSAP